MSILDRLIRREEPQPSNPVLEVSMLARKHIRDIMPIEEAVYPKPWTAKVFSEEIDMMMRGRRHYVVAHIGRDLVGY